MKVKEVDPDLVVELGLFVGYSAVRYLMHNCTAATMKPSRHFLIDVLILLSRCELLGSCAPQPS